MAIKKVFLLQPMHEKEKKTPGRTSFSFPYGLGYISRVLEDAGFGIEVLDAHALQLEKTEVMDRLRGADFDILGISAFSTQYNVVKIISQFVKERLDKPVIVGGPLATYSARLTLLTTPVDFCVMGEGEITVVDLLKNINNYQTVKGIAFKQDGKVIFTSERPYIKNLDDIPRPAYHWFPMEKYLYAKPYIGRYAGKRKEGYENLRAMHFITQRGCPYQCKFCSKNFRGLRIMSVDKAIEEIKYLKETYNLGGISFADELFLSSFERMREFAPKMKKLNLVWFGQARANLVNYEILKMMKDAGCRGIGLGIESGSQKILDNMRKGITVKQIEEAMAAARKLDLQVKVQLMFGYPGENEETVKETVELMKRVHHPGSRFALTTALPGAALYEECLTKGSIKDEAEYLTSIEKEFGQKRLLINFTEFPDEEVFKRMHATERLMRMNYYKWRPWLPVLFFFKKATTKGFRLCKKIIRKLSVSL